MVEGLERSSKEAQDAGPFKCPRCHYGYSKVEGVRKHFPKCVALNGNPRCNAWTDHHSYLIRWRLGSKSQGFSPIRQGFLDPASGWDNARAATRRQVQSLASKGYATYATPMALYPMAPAELIVSQLKVQLPNSSIYGVVATLSSQDPNLSFATRVRLPSTF